MQEANRRNKTAREGINEKDIRKMLADLTDILCRLLSDVICRFEVDSSNWRSIRSPVSVKNKQFHIVRPWKEEFVVLLFCVGGGGNWWSYLTSKRAGFPIHSLSRVAEAPLLSRHPLGSPIFLYKFHFLSLLYIFLPRNAWNFMKNEDFLQRGTANILKRFATFGCLCRRNVIMQLVCYVPRQECNGWWRRACKVAFIDWSFILMKSLS